MNEASDPTVPASDELVEAPAVRMIWGVINSSCDSIPLRGTTRRVRPAR